MTTGVALEFVFLVVNDFVEAIKAKPTRQSFGEDSIELFVDGHVRDVDFAFYGLVRSAFAFFDLDVRQECCNVGKNIIGQCVDHDTYCVFSPASM